MKRTRILIIGDSFASDWSVKYQDYPGWPNLLSQEFDVTNLAQAGVGEFKIYKQLQSVTDLHNYDLVIVSHTSPYRIHTRKHPVHASDKLHKNADLILTDIDYHESKIKNIFNLSLKAAKWFFYKHYDIDYFETIYGMLREKINLMLEGTPVIVISNLPCLENFETEPVVLHFSDLCKESPGIINHVSEQANQKIFNKLKSLISEIMKG